MQQPLESFDELIQRMEEKVKAVYGEARVTYSLERGEIYVGLYGHIGKAHKNVRTTISRRVKRCKRFANYTVIIFLVHSKREKTCMAFELPLGEQRSWKKATRRRVDERLIA